MDALVLVMGALVETVVGNGCFCIRCVRTMGALVGAMGELVGTLVSAWARSVCAVGALRCGMGVDGQW